MDNDSVTRLRRVVGKLARQLNASATGEGLTPTQASVLGLVAGRGPLSIAALTELEGLNPTMLSRVLSKLDEAGLVERIRDPADLRTASVRITPEGNRIHERIRNRRTAIVSECVARLPAKHADALTRALPALEALVDELHITDSRSVG
ncbi:MAG TPA: MarR family transcriptional regulator [Micromonosporaceae bacterium]|nr:MarR family transcriptional regulator [Micromonosporaceae bacterium]